MNKITNIFLSFFFFLGLISIDLSANEFGISDTKLNEINERVQYSSVSELLLLNKS